MKIAIALLVSILLWILSGAYVADHFWSNNQSISKEWLSFWICGNIITSGLLISGAAISSINDSFKKRHTGDEIGLDYHEFKIGDHE